MRSTVYTTFLHMNGLLLYTRMLTCDMIERPSAHPLRPYLVIVQSLPSIGGVQRGVDWRHVVQVVHGAQLVHEARLEAIVHQAYHAVHYR